MSEEKILIIDDDKIIRSIVSKALEKSGFVALSATNGSEGLEIAQKDSPDAIVLDRTMPGMDGNEVLEKLKENPETKNIPVMILTGRSSGLDISSSMQLGALDYVVKPFDEENFIIRIKNLVKRST